MKHILSAGNKLIAALIIVLTVMAVFIPIFDVLQKFQDYLVHILFFLLLSGIVGLIISNKTILYTSFGCAVILALFLKNASNLELKSPKINDEVKISVAHVNLSLITDINAVIKIIQDKNLDLISFQEYTPDWAEILPQITQKTFPYSFVDIRIDLYGKAIFSKIKIHSQNKVQQIEAPYLEVVLGDDQKFTVLSSYITPALDNISKQKAKVELDGLESYFSKNNHGKIIMGEFNQVYWSHDILAFRNKTGLLNSRRNVDPSTFKMPYHHIFYSNDIECYHFEELYDAIGNHIGCKAAFQFKKPNK